MTGIGSTELNILGLTANSSAVEPGFLFAAFDGTVTDGYLFIPEALSRGAVAVLAHSGRALDKLLETNPSVTLITSENPRLTYAKFSARYYQLQPKFVVGITGTNGKSSVAEFVRQLWALDGLEAASLGTLGLIGPSGTVSSRLTTPDSADLHCKLARLVQNNINFMTLEASSHGLSQHRLDGVRIPVAAFTNLSRDHMDYHVTLDNYRAAKLRLFSEVLVAGGIAVLNRDDRCYEIINNIVTARGGTVLSYGWNGRDLRLDNLQPHRDGQQLDLTVQGIKKSVWLPLIGDFQALNALCAVGVVLAVGGNPDDTINRLGHLVTVRGRLELATKLSNGATIYVDYAHTPDALKKVLIAMRSHTIGNLFLVFGCGGDRDSGKRKEMGIIASKYADEVVITDDNPRTEDPALIRNQIFGNCGGASVITDRKQAISESISRLKSDDSLVIAGKGHESEQIFHSKKMAFDDVDVANTIALNYQTREVYQ